MQPDAAAPDEPDGSGGRLGSGGSRSPGTPHPRCLRPSRRRGVLRRRHDRPLRRRRRGHGDRLAHAGRGRPDPRRRRSDAADARRGQGQGARACRHRPRGGRRHVPRLRGRPPRAPSRSASSPQWSAPRSSSSAPDVVVTFGPDGAFGHPDHVISCLATLEAIRQMDDPPRLLHARFPMREQLLVDVLVEWLTSSPALQRHRRVRLRAEAVRRRILDARFRRRSPRVEWFPPGSFVIEQGEPATELFCILSGSVDIVVEDDDGSMQLKAHVRRRLLRRRGRALDPVDRRNAHVIARDDVTCLVLAPNRPTPYCRARCTCRRRSTGDKRTAARHRSARHRRQRRLLRRRDVDARAPRSPLWRRTDRSTRWSPTCSPARCSQRLLGTEHFAVATIPGR